MDNHKFLENLDTIIKYLKENEDIMDTSLDNEFSSVDTNVSNDDLLNQLNQIFTPILIMQGIEGNSADEINKTLSESNLLVERNIIKFDNSTRMAQLISVCAILIQKQKNTEKYQMYKKAITIANSTKLDMQKEELTAAKALAQKYLVAVSTTNNSSVARNAANQLLPETQN